MRFQVPQFIEKETKVIGPLTLKQFGWYLGAAAIFILIQFFVSGTPLFIVAAILLSIATALAYLKINDVSLPGYIFMAFTFFMSEKKYTFRKEEEEPQVQTDGK